MTPKFGTINCAKTLKFSEVTITQNEFNETQSPTSRLPAVLNDTIQRHKKDGRVWKSVWTGIMNPSIRTAWISTHQRQVRRPRYKRNA